jgi:hypothetical protein
VLPKDPWGNPYIYYYPGKHNPTGYDLLSVGPDGKEGTEARRLVALMHAGQSRAVSEGLPMVLWVNEKQGTYGLQAEATGRGGDPRAENLSLDENLQITVVNTGSGDSSRFGGLPAIRFLPDGTVDESSPQTLRLIDAKGQALWLIESRDHNGYEIRDTEK